MCNTWDLLTGDFKQALKDYLFLKNRGYPEKSALKLVGDRSRLSKVQRMVLYRGITSTEQARLRKKKLTRDLTGKTLLLDGYNVFFTLMNYLLGKTVFVGNDGILRDIGEGYGKIENEDLFYRAKGILLEFIGGIKTEAPVFYLDHPVSGSSRHGQELERQMRELNINGEVRLVPSADEALIKTAQETGGAVVATSDSHIIDTLDDRSNIYDAGREIIELEFGVEILDLDKLL